MQLFGKLIQLLPVQVGAGKIGNWKRQDVIVETDGKYPKNCVYQFGAIQAVQYFTLLSIYKWR